MEEMKKIINQTPIEIALGIGEDGTTTAKALYDFLEFAPNNYARWCKRNITQNEFAEENVDFWAVFPAEERNFNPCPTQDYRLTASFAKKLSMMAKSEKGEQARKYFVSIEDKAKDMVLMLREASGNPMKLLELHYAAIKQVDKRVDGVESRVKELEQTMTLDYGQQAILGQTVNKTVLNHLGGKESPAYKPIGRRVFAECNSDLKHYFKVNARANVPKKRYEEAVAYAENWKPCTNTIMLIKEYNSQNRLDI